jgi:hypothetical protein
MGPMLRQLLAVLPCTGLLAWMSVGLFACASVDLRAATAARVECAPAEIEVFDEELSPGVYRWGARCRGQAYQCHLEAGQPRATCSPSK